MVPNSSHSLGYKYHEIALQCQKKKTPEPSTTFDVPALFPVKQAERQGFVPLPFPYPFAICNLQPKSPIHKGFVRSHLN